MQFGLCAIVVLSVLLVSTSGLHLRNSNSLFQYRRRIVSHPNTNLKQQCRESYPISTRLEADNTSSTDQPNLVTEDEDDKNSAQITKLVTYIVSAIEDGREQELIDAGMIITKKSKMEAFNDKLANDELSKRILGEPDDEQLEFLRRWNEVNQNEVANNNNESAEDTSIDLEGLQLPPEIVDSLRKEAMLTIQALRQQGTTMASLIEDDSISTGEDFMAKLKSLDLSATNESDTAVSINSDSNAEDVKDIIYRNMMKKPDLGTATAGKGFGKITSSNNNNNNNNSNKNKEQFIIKESALRNELSRGENTISGSDSDAAEETQLNKLIIDAEQAVSGAPRAAVSPGSRISNLDPLKTAIKEEEAVVVPAEIAFKELLKVSMDEAQSLAGDISTLDEGLKQATMAAVATGDLAQLDMKALMGEAMFLMAEQLGVNPASELSSDAQSKTKMQAILNQSMAELAASMSEIDSSNSELFKKLQVLQEDLKREGEEAFEAKKDDEWDTLLAAQQMMSREYLDAQETLQDRTKRLASLMTELQESAGGVTAVALFPVKPFGKQAAFIVGLSLLFKVPFDVVRLFLSGFPFLDVNDWISLGTQSLLCLALFHFYGIFGANQIPKSIPEGPISK